MSFANLDFFDILFFRKRDNCFCFSFGDALLFNKPFARILFFNFSNLSRWLEEVDLIFGNLSSDWLFLFELFSRANSDWELTASFIFGFFGLLSSEVSLPSPILENEIISNENVDQIKPNPTFIITEIKKMLLHSKYMVIFWLHYFACSVVYFINCLSMRSFICLSFSYSLCIFLECI